MRDTMKDEKNMLETTVKRYDYWSVDKPRRLRIESLGAATEVSYGELVLHATFQCLANAFNKKFDSHWVNEFYGDHKPPQGAEEDWGELVRLHDWWIHERPRRTCRYFDMEPPRGALNSLLPSHNGVLTPEIQAWYNVMEEYEILQAKWDEEDKTMLAQLVTNIDLLWEMIDFTM
jgi:hypothetical protein